MSGFTKRDATKVGVKNGGETQDQQELDGGNAKNGTELERGQKVVSEIQQAPWAIQPDWWFEDNLKYVVPADGQDGSGDGNSEPTCSFSNCPKRSLAKQSPVEEQPPAKMMRCSICGGKYCSKECFKGAWKQGHKRECPLIAACKKNELTPELNHTIMEEMLRRIRLYMCPYNVAFNLVRGQGFVYLRSDFTLSQWIYGAHGFDDRGVYLNRSVQLQYLTIGEFDGLAFEDNFEMAAIRPFLVEALEKYDPKKQIIVVMLLRCGFFAGVTLPLVPDFGICQGLAVHYKYAQMEGPLQLNVDDDQ